MDFIPIIIFFVLASMASSAFIFFVMRRGQQKQDGIKDLAAAQGWTYAHQPPTMRRGSVTTMTDPADDWSLRLSVSGGSGSTNRTLDWHSNSGGIPSGAAFLGPDLPEKTMQMIEGPMAAMGGKLIRQLFFQHAGKIDGVTDDLTFVPATGQDGKGVVIASPDAMDAMTPIRNDPALVAARAGQNQMMQPIVARTADGLSMRVRVGYDPTEQLVDFVTLGKTLRERVS